MRALRAEPRTLRRGGRLQPVRRYLSDLGPACTGTIGIAPSANLNPGATSVAVRTGARLGAGHFRQEHRQPDRHDLERRDDAGLLGDGDARYRRAHDGIRRRSSASSPTGRARRTCAAMPPPSKSAGDRRPAATLSITDFPVRGALSRPALPRPFSASIAAANPLKTTAESTPIPRPRSQQIVYILCFILLQMPQLWPSCNLCTLENVNEE